MDDHGENSRTDSNNGKNSSNRLRSFGPNIWYVDGPDVDFFTYPYPTRMVVIRLSEQNDKDEDDKGDGGTSSFRSWIWSPIELTDELANEVEEAAGRVKYLVSPNLIHWVFLKAWQDRFPEALVYGTKGLVERECAKAIHFSHVLTDDEATETKDLQQYSTEIEQILFRSTWFEEAVFYHKESKTVIFGDLIQRFPQERIKGFKGWLLKIDGMAGSGGGAPGELRFLTWMGGHMPETRRKLNRILYTWQPDRLIIAHGMNAESDAIQVIANSFRWVPENPKPCMCGCIPSAGSVSQDSSLAAP